jgi:hypothetical protein
MTNTLYGVINTSQPITKDRALPVKIPMNSIEEDAEGTHVQNKNMTKEFQQDDAQANSHAAKGVTHAAQGINHAIQGVSPSWRYFSIFWRHFLALW